MKCATELSHWQTARTLRDPTSRNVCGVKPLAGRGGTQPAELGGDLEGGDQREQRLLEYSSPRSCTASRQQPDQVAADQQQVYIVHYHEILHFALYHGFISSMSCIPYFCTLCKLCMVSILTFILRKSKKGIFSPLASKRFLGTHSKYQMQVCNKILETCPPHVHQKVCGGQVE